MVLYWNTSADCPILTHLYADMMHPSRFVLLKESSYWALLPQRVQELQLGVAQFHKHGVHAVLRQRHGSAHLGTQNVTVQRGGLLQVGHGYGNVIQPTEFPDWRWHSLTKWSRWGEGSEGRCCVL